MSTLVAKIAPSRTPTPASGHDNSGSDTNDTQQSRKTSVDPDNDLTQYNNQLELYEAHGFPPTPEHQRVVVPVVEQRNDDQQEHFESKVRISYNACC